MELNEPSYRVVNRGPSAATVVFLSLLTSILASAATVVAIERFGIPGLAPAGSEIAEVPDLTGLSQSAADEILRARKLRLLVGSHAASPTAPGAVVSQSPLAGSRVKDGDAVSVVLSSGPAEVEVPAVVAQPVAEAERLLTAAGLVVGELKQGGPGEAGTVTASEPAPGSQVSAGSTVSLTVAEDAKVVVPDLDNEHVSQAKETLVSLGLSVGTVRERYNSHRRGYRVLEQSPKAGSEVEKGAAVDLIINQGD